MVTFVCSYCDATLKKKQTERHAFGSCRPASFICIDCHKTFNGNQYKAHTSCLTEFEKHWGEYAKKPKGQQPQNQPQGQQQKQTEQNGKHVTEESDKKNGTKNGVSQVNHKNGKASVKSEPAAQVHQNEESQWRGWKNQIKSHLKTHSATESDTDIKVPFDTICESLTKRYKQCTPQCDMEDEELRQLFAEKVKKVKKVKVVTYVVLE